MNVVPLISLVDVSSNEKHLLNSSQSVIGRGWLNVSSNCTKITNFHKTFPRTNDSLSFQCNDKRISRNHGVLKVISPNSVTVISVR